jgi:hypothetical protein
MKRSDRNNLLRGHKVNTSLISLIKILRRLGLPSPLLKSSHGWIGYIDRCMPKGIK